jgi:hypothetical protein
MKSLTHDNIITALETFKLDAGAIPETFYTDFDPKLIKGKTAEWIRKEESQVHAAPPACQDKNGLVECNWNVAVDMARAYLMDAQMPRTFWFHAIQHATRVCNIFPCKVNGKVTMAHELAYGIKPDYRVLFCLFSVGYFKAYKDGNHFRNGIGEAQSKQGIAIGRNRLTNAMEFYCPHTKTIVPAADFTLDEARSTPLAFNLKYDGGLFFCLYDHSPASRGIEPYPEGTSVRVNSLPGMVIVIPISSFDQGIPNSDADQFYTVRLSDDSVMKFSVPEMPSIIPVPMSNAPPLSLPAWICSNHKALYLAT